PLQFANYLAIKWLDENERQDYENITHDFWVSRVNKIGKKEWRNFAESDLVKADKFYVSPAPEEQPGLFWLDVGLSILQEAFFLISF
ncbi:MAG: hypothetical protein AB8G22_02875, partial [Saprospiraceae bacterium]